MLVVCVCLTGIEIFDIKLVPQCIRFWNRGWFDISHTHDTINSYLLFSLVIYRDLFPLQSGKTRPFFSSKPQDSSPLCLSRENTTQTDSCALIRKIIVPGSLQELIWSRISWKLESFRLGWKLTPTLVSGCWFKKSMCLNHYKNFFRAKLAKNWATPTGLKFYT